MKKISAILIAIVMLGGLLCGYAAPAAALDNDYALWQEKTRAALTGDMSSVVSADSSNLAWGSSYALNAFCRAYQATGEEVYLEKAGGYLYEIFQLAQDNDGDGYKNWGTGEYNGGKYDEFCVHTGALLSSAGEWANLVLSSPRLLNKAEPVSGMTYSALCDYLVGEATRNMIPAFDCDWNRRLGIYMNRPGSGNYGGSTDKISLPNNQFLAMAAALIQFAKLSPERETQYLRRAKAMLDAFHCKLRYNCKGNITRWNYKDKYFLCDKSASKEDFSHGMWSARAAIMGYANGLSFSEDNIKAFARVYKGMVRGTAEEPLLTERMNGSGSQDNTLYLFIYDLSPFGDAIWSTGYKTAVFRDDVRAVDTARILAYHEAAPAPLAFGLLAPESGARCRGRTLFRWEPAVHACKYTLQISGREDFADLLVDRASILDTSAFVEGLPGGMTLYWRVAAANQGGRTFVSEPSMIVTEHRFGMLQEKWYE